MIKNAGKKFEEDFKKSIPNDVYYERLKDSTGAWFNQDNENVRFTSKQPYDAFIFKSPFLFTLELKSTISTSFSFTGKSPNIKDHQINSLLKSHEYENIISGFIFNFRRNNDTYFLRINNFLNFKNNTTKCSLNLNDIIINDGVKIQARLLRTRYRYDVKHFVNYYLCFYNK